jgi:hypothetical protein
LCEKLFDISTLDLSMTYIIVFSIKVKQNDPSLMFILISYTHYIVGWGAWGHRAK